MGVGSHGEVAIYLQVREVNIYILCLASEAIKIKL